MIQRPGQARSLRRANAYGVKISHWTYDAEELNPIRHLSTLPGWREFTTLAPGQPELLAAAEYASLGDDARSAYEEERLDYHTRLGVVGTSVLRQVVTTGRRLTLLNRHAISA